MQVTAHHSQDLTEFDRRIRGEGRAKQRDRYRAVRLALAGELTTTIMARLERSKNFVQRWCYAYRDGGLGAMVDKPRSGRPTKLPRDQERPFKQRLLNGPTDADGGVCTLRGKDVVRILEREFGVHYTLDGAYDLLHRLGLSCLKPRPRHRRNDLHVMQQWLERAPLLSKTYSEHTRTSRSRCGSRTKRASVSKAR
jgi:transposase